MKQNFLTFLKMIVKIILTPVAVFLWYALLMDLREILGAEDFSPISKADIVEYLMVIIPLMYFILFF